MTDAATLVTAMLKEFVKTPELERKDLIAGWTKRLAQRDKDVAHETLQLVLSLSNDVIGDNGTVTEGVLYVADIKKLDQQLLENQDG